MSIVYGTNKNDVLDYGAPGSGFTIYGGDGDDLLSTGGSDDALYGGAGNDSLWGGTQSNIIDGGDGIDTLYAIGTIEDPGSWYLAQVWDLRIDGPQFMPDYYPPIGLVFTLVSVENFHFYSGGNNRLSGNEAANSIWTWEGNDQSFGHGGNDSLYGNAGNDSLYGGADNDQIFGGDGDDTLSGEVGDDSIEGGAGNDSILFGYGNDTINGGDGNDVIDDIAGTQLSGNNLIDGGGGDDSVWAGLGNDNVAGGAGDDFLSGDDGNDFITGDVGDDRIYGEAGDDQVFGGDGSDTLWVGSGDDLIDGGLGADTAVWEVDFKDATFSRGDGVVLVTTSQGVDTLRDVEYLRFVDGTIGIDALALNAPPTGTVTISGSARQGQTLVADVSGIADADGMSSETVSNFASAPGNTRLWTITGVPITKADLGRTYAASMFEGTGFTSITVNRDGSLTFNGAVPGGATLAGGISFNDGTRVDFDGSVAHFELTPGAVVYITPSYGEPFLFTPEFARSAFGLTEANQHYTSQRSYQWFRGDEAISGATGATYTLTQADVGADIYVSYSFVDDGGTQETMNSNSIPAVQNVNDAPAGAVTISGTARQGQTLVVDASALSDADGIDATSVAFQWLRDGNPISGANAQTYVLTAADAARNISVRYSYMDNYGTEEAVTSAATRVSANSPAVIVAASASTTGEDGSGTEVSVSLATAPVYPVTITFAVSDSSEASLSVTSLTFTAANWNVAQTLTITGVDDYADDGNVAFNLTGTISTDDLSYTRVVVPTLVLTNTDDGLDRGVQIYGDNEINYLSGNNGNDRIYGGGNLDELRGSRGDDRLYGDQDDDRLYGDEGADWLYGGYDDDRLFGGVGDDELYGEAGADTLSGGDGNDLIDGGTGADRMSGNAGDDTYYVDNANDVVIDGGLATDVDAVVLLASITYTLSNTVENASLDDSSGDAGLTGNQLNNLLAGNAGDNALTGGGGSDTLTGGDGVDTLYAGDGNDTVDGGAGSDLIVGGNGAGNDVYRGGAGVDTIRYSSATAGITVNLETGTARSLSGDAAGIGRDRLSGIEAVIAGRFNDVITGNSSANQLSGAEGRDRLIGQAGADQLNGGAGADTLTGGAGRDRLTGGDGADVFVFGKITETGKTSTTRDVITDFQSGIDDIDLQAIDANTARTGNQAFTFIGSNAFSSTAGELRFAGGVISGDVNGDGRADFQIGLTGVSALAAGDFIL